MKSEQSILKLQPHVSQKKNEKYKGLFLCDNRKSFTDQKMLIKSAHAKSNLTAQMQFNIPANQANIITNYTEAANAWNNSLAQVTAFVNAYAADGNFANINMENNMVRKSEKAATMLAGESYETYRWQQGLNNTYFGPGAFWGIDIKQYINSNHHLAIGQAAEEVKSSESIHWRNLFGGVPHGIIRVAYLSGAALADAQASAAPAPWQAGYSYYDKANPNGPVATCI